ncbi:MAG: zinc ribbon domain-containing protein [Actinomycetota bacterium]|nr:zinc ribbon domain-containing protein [Actinomycetota bacterium]
MSYCPKCGNRLDKAAFRCTNCGTLLANGPQRNGLPLNVRLAKYKNPLILVALAAIILMTRSVFVVTGIYWVIIVGLLGALLYTVLKNWREKRAYHDQRQDRRGAQRPNSLTGYGPPRSHVPKPMPKKRTNVIPFKKKRDPKSKTKPD